MVAEEFAATPMETSNFSIGFDTSTTLDEEDKGEKSDKVDDGLPSFFSKVFIQETIGNLQTEKEELENKLGEATTKSEQLQRELDNANERAEELQREKDRKSVV